MGYSNRKGVGITPPLPEQLKRARLARGFTMTELAELVGVSKQAISNYEKGENIPSAEVFAKIKQVLGFPTQFFTYPMKSKQPDTVTFFRSLKSATQSDRWKQSVRVDFIHWIFDFLSQYIDFPPVNLPKIDERLLHDPSDEDIEDIATIVRRHWKLGDGPISNVVLLLEKNGIIVANTPFYNEKLDGFSELRERPFVFLSDDKSSAVRARFNAAHELGHLILHSWMDVNEFNEKSLDKIEKQAHLFARAFLLPRETFANEVVSTSLEHFIELKRRWKVSIQAMIFRCADLGLLSEHQILYLRRQIAAKKMRKKEPLDDLLVREEPTIIKRAVELLVENNIFTPEQLLYKFGLYAEDIEELLGIKKEFFAPVENDVDIRLKSRKPHLTLVKSDKK